MTKDFVFISYSREDRAFVDRLSEDLRMEGITTWQDTKEIAPGEDWRLAIEGSLRQASALLYVASARSVNSQWMSRELEGVLSRGGRIIPVVVDDQGEQGLPQFRSTSGSDMRQRSGNCYLLFNRFAQSARLNREQSKPEGMCSSAMPRKTLRSSMN